MIRKITKKDREQAGKTIYKAVRVEKSGRLRSLWVEGTKKHPLILYPCKLVRHKLIALTYKPDHVISDGKYGIWYGKYGIWCCTTIEYARYQVCCNAKGFLCKVYAIRPIGQPIKAPEDWYPDEGTVLYPAIIMGELVETIDYREAT